VSLPLVSVVIPVYNGERYLAEAIESVLHQSYQPLELIVVDDGSTDGSAAVAQRYGPRLQYHHQPNAGYCGARNAGLRLARGDVFAHLDADDLWPPDSLASRLAALLAEPGLDLVAGHVEQFYSPDTDDAYRRRVRCPADPMPGYLAASMVVRRESFFRVGWYETQWTIGGDMSWYMRAVDARLKVRMLPQVVLRRRLHERNSGLTRQDCQVQRLAVLKAALDRRRGRPAAGPG